MTLETIRHHERRATGLTAQVCHLQEHCPDLYRYLTERDRALERALARIPSHADIELSSIFNARAYLEKMKWEITPGLGDLCERAISESASQGGPTEEEVIDG